MTVLNGSLLVKFGFDGQMSLHRGEPVSVYVDANLVASAEGLAHMYTSTRDAFFAIRSDFWSEDDRAAAWDSWYLISIEQADGAVFVERRGKRRLAEASKEFRKAAPWKKKRAA
jgi:hypothetical protein